MYMKEFFTYHDIFATKGVEYLVILLFLFSIVFIWKYLERPPY